MERRREWSAKDAVNARFQSSRFVYDGKRVQPVYDRKSYDFASGTVYQQQMSVLRPISDPRYNLCSQTLTLPPPETALTSDNVAYRFLHMCINKVRSPVNAIAWNMDGRRLLSGSSSGEITMWNGFSFNFDTILQAHESPVRTMCWSPSATFLITGDSVGVIKYWHPSMNNIQLIEAHTESIKDLCFSYSDAKFCTASDDACIKIWDSAMSRCERVLVGHNWDVRKAQWHPHYSLIASGGKDNLIKLWDPRIDGAIATFHHHKNTILSMRWLKSESLLTGGKDQVIKRLDLRTMTDAFTYKSTNRDATSLAVHPHADLFASGCNDGAILHWDRDSEHPIHECDNKHNNTVWGLDYHPAGHILASGSSDFMIKFWGRMQPYHHWTGAAARDDDPAHGTQKSDDFAIPGL